MKFTKLTCTLITACALIAGVTSVANAAPQTQVAGAMPAQPRLDFNVQDPQLRVGEDPTFVATVKNWTDKPATYSMTFGMGLNPTSLARSGSVTLDPGEEGTITVTLPASELTPDMANTEQDVRVFISNGSNQRSTHLTFAVLPALPTVQQEQSHALGIGLGVGVTLLTLGVALAVIFRDHITALLPK